MGGVERGRLRALEARLGAAIPDVLLAALSEREPISEGAVAIVAADRVWDVRTTFSLNPGGREAQLDGLYELVGDALPPGALPFAEDWGGNLYCLMLSGPLAGQVVWWDHERGEGEDGVEPVAASVADFFARLAPDPRQ